MQITGPLRKKLRNSGEDTNEEFFRTLYRAFCYNPVCLICLCFLAEEYEIAYHVLQTYSLEYEVGQAVLLEFCKLVNLLESPNFICTFAFTQTCEFSLWRRAVIRF